MQLCNGYKSKVAIEGSKRLRAAVCYPFHSGQFTYSVSLRDSMSKGQLTVTFPARQDRLSHGEKGGGELLCWAPRGEGCALAVCKARRRKTNILFGWVKTSKSESKHP
eukprot:6173192-Pleurochrysis_carterae.AAC.3